MGYLPHDKIMPSTEGISLSRHRPEIVHKKSSRTCTFFILGTKHLGRWYHRAADITTIVQDLLGCRSPILAACGNQKTAMVYCLISTVCSGKLLDDGPRDLGPQVLGSRRSSSTSHSACDSFCKKVWAWTNVKSILLQLRTKSMPCSRVQYC